MNITNEAMIDRGATDPERVRGKQVGPDARPTGLIKTQIKTFGASGIEAEKGGGASGESDRQPKPAGLIKSFEARPPRAAGGRRESTTHQAKVQMSGKRGSLVGESRFLPFSGKAKT